MPAPFWNWMERAHMVDEVLTLPLMLFAGTEGAEVVAFCVSWNLRTERFECDCDEPEACPHIRYAEQKCRDDNGELLLIPGSADVSRQEMEALANDVPRLRQWLLERLIIIDEATWAAVDRRE